jgi:hypothetical protein
MLIQLKTNPIIMQELQKLGYADEQITARVAEAARDTLAGAAQATSCPYTCYTYSEG